MLKIFRQVALWEAVSTVILFFIAMPLKYFADIPEAVRVAGSIHGFLVVIFVPLLIYCAIKYKWEWTRPVAYFTVSLFPIISFLVEIDLKKIIAGKKV